MVIVGVGEWERGGGTGNHKEPQLLTISTPIQYFRVLTTTVYRWEKDML